MRDGERPERQPWRLAAARFLRRKPRTYLEVWAIVAVSAVPYAIFVSIIAGWSPKGGVAFFGSAPIWLGFGISQSYLLHRRRMAGDRHQLRPGSSDRAETPSLG
jgi:hypothetical protein